MVRRLLMVLALSAVMRADAQGLTPLELGPAAGGALSAAGERLLRAHVAGGQDAELRWSDFRDLRDPLERFYGSRGWTLAWHRDGRPTDAAWQVAGVLAAAARKGLDPLDYAADQLEPRLARAEQTLAPEPERVRIDVALTVSALRYVGDLALGRIRPVPGTELLGRPQLARNADPPPDLAALVAEAAGAIDPARVLSGAEPDWPAYRRTLAALDRWLARAAAGPTPPLEPPGESAAPEEYPQAALLAARLEALGFLATAPREGAGACRSPLAEALGRFQERRGLDASGFVDAPTVAALNVPAERRVAQLALSLERWRWFGRRPPEAWIVVNVPEFALHAGDGDRALSTRVVVGRAFERGTPLFSSQLSQVTFRPAWSVPPTIQEQELVPRVEADGAFLAAADFEVIDEAERPTPPLAPADLLAGLRNGALHLRQRPGAANALGLVRFDLARSARIYLHGTPATELFTRSRRDFSHGCIRVEDPARLAEWVLRDEPGWTPNAIRLAMGGGRTREAALRHPPIVLIAYFTATAWDDGVAGFYEDVYGQDAALAGALREEAARRGGE